MLKEPIALENTMLSNRLVMAPVDLEKSDHGTVTEERGEEGLSLLIQ